MVICIISSLDFTSQILDLEQKLIELGHIVKIPPTSEMIRRGEISLQDISREKESGEIVARTIRQDSIREAFDRISKADGVLVLNYDKDGIKNYIGGNTFLEIGFAHVLKKRIFLFNPIPKMNYEHEISAMGPKVILGDIKKLI